MSVSKEEFRQVIGTFATGVTIVTTRSNGQFHGMTANAVCSVSLEPLLILVCVDRQNDTHKIISDGGVFALNILSADQEHLSRRFATKELQGAHSFDDLPYRLSTTGCPLLEGSLAFLDCRVVAAYPGGDHTIFIGEVQEVSSLKDENPLIFYKGKYATLKQEEKSPSS